MISINFRKIKTAAQILETRQNIDKTAVRQQSVPVLLATLLLALTVIWPNSPQAHGSNKATAAATIEMQAHKSYFQEKCIELPANTTLHVSMQTDSTVMFDIHSHPGLETVFWVRELVQSRFETPLYIKDKGEYCLTWMTHETVAEPFEVTYTYSTTNR